MSISMSSAPFGAERRRGTSKFVTCSQKKTSKVVAVLRANLNPSRAAQAATGPNSRFQFQKRRQLFVRVHNETLSVAMRVHNPDRSLVGING